MTICKLCKHFVSSGDIWYEQFCKAQPKPISINPVTGKHGYQSVNDLGQVYFTDNPYHYSRDINNGDCKLFKLKGMP